MLCKGFHCYYVAGIGGTDANNFRREVTTMRETIFGLACDESQISVLTNKTDPLSVLLSTRDEDLFETIKKKAQASRSSKCRGIRIVWFAHSHGAKMVVDAYREMKNLSYFRDICNASAIITIGGISLADKSLAQITLNVMFKNDKIAQDTANAVGETDGDTLLIGPFENATCKCCEKGEPGHKPEKKQISKTNPLFAWSTMSSTASSQSVKGNKAEAAHYISEYLSCRQWRVEVQKLLGTPNCRC